MLSWRTLAREWPGGCHSAELTPRLPLTSVPHSPHLPRRGPRYCGSSDCGPAFASSRESPSARKCPACSQRPRPLSFLWSGCWCRRSLSSSPPSVPFRLSPAACRGGGESQRRPALGAWLRPPSASGGVRAPALQTFGRSAALCGSALALRSAPPGASFRLREDL